jgi:hypothetical protein
MTFPNWHDDIIPSAYVLRSPKKLQSDIRSVSFKPWHNYQNIKVMVRFSAMSLVLTALVAVNKVAAFSVKPVSRSIGRSFTQLAASDDDFDGFSSKVRELNELAFSVFLQSFW